MPRNTRYQKGRQFTKAAPLFRHFPRGNDEIRLCARATRLGSPIAFLKRVKILTEGTDSVTECLIILDDLLTSLDTPSQKVLVCQITSEKMKNDRELCAWLLKPMGVRNARRHARCHVGYTMRYNTRRHASRYEQSVERTAQIVHFPCTWAILIASYVQDAQ